MGKLQLDRYKRGYLHKLWIEYYCLGENHLSGTLSSKLIRCQSPYQLQNLEILLTFQRHKNSHGQNFWNLIFLSEKTRLYRYYKKKNSLEVTSSSYINLTMIVDKVVK